MISYIVVAFITALPYYHWYKIDVAPAKPEWHYLVPQKEFIDLCGKGAAACAYLNPGVSCHIFTPYNKYQILWMKDVDGMPMKEHEEKHCKGWRHHNGN